MSREKIARRYLVRGRVQGVGYRYFAEHAATALGIDGWVRNLDDGRVEVFAVGEAGELSAFEGHLWKGPRWADVRGVDIEEAAVQNLRGFNVRH